MKKLLLFLLALPILSFGQATLVTDINLGTASSSPTNKIKFNNEVYFIANDGINGMELWKTDGTENGTVLFKEFIAGPENGLSRLIASECNNKLYFMVANNTFTGTSLWSTDGTIANTTEIKSFNVGSSHFYGVVNNKLLFAAQNELWSTDGTEAGTTFVNNTIVFGQDRFTIANNEMYFSGNGNDGAGNELWKTDGTTAGTTRLKDIAAGSSNSYPSNFNVANNIVFFTANDGSTGVELWTTDGTEAGTTLLDDITSGSSGTFSYSNPFAVFNNELHFMVGTKLWKTNGTQSGTIEVKDIVNDVKAMLVFNNSINIFNYDASFWISDGTTAGTTEVDLPIIEEFFHNSQYAVVGNELFLQARSKVEGYEIWKTNGTPEGTILLKDIHPAFDDGNINDIIELNGKALFTANDNNWYGQELWISDGTPQETKILKDINAVMNRGSLPNSFFDFKNETYFVADNGVNGYELWKTDGVNSTLIKDINPGPYYSNPRGFVVLNNHFYFMATTKEKGTELWKSDGTEAGTTLVKDINPDHENGLGSGNLAVANNEVYFFANNGSTGRELWKSDGTEAGTILVKDINTGNLDGGKGNLISYKNKVYFSAHTGDGDFELWESDGTEAGTLIHHHYNYSGSSNPGNFIVFNDELYYRSNQDLIKTDGTTATKVSNTDPANLTISNNKLFFTATYSDGGELWATDGTTASLVKDIRPGSQGSYPSTLTDHNGTLFFVADDSSNGKELWKSDGTEAGTVMVKDIVVGSGSTQINSIGSIGNHLFFNAPQDPDNAPYYNYELWISDGTSEETKLFQDINPDSGAYSSASNPANFFVSQDKMYFMADDGSKGYELWVLNESALSIDDIKQKELVELSLYPNPTSNILNFKIDNQEIKKVTIYNILGKEIFQKTDNNIRSVNLQNFKSGIYLVNIQTDKNKITKKIIKH